MNSDCSPTVDPSQLRLELKIPNGRAVELALFEALLSYAEGIPVIINVHDSSNNREYLLHGRETCELVAAGRSELGGIKAKVIYLAGDAAGLAEDLGRAFNAEECDWPEMLEAGRQCFMQDSPCSESYVAWLKHEIAMRRLQ